MADTTPVTTTTPPMLRRVGLAMLPFTPVSFDGVDSMYAWTRLIVYSAGAALVWKRQKTIAYGFAAAAGMSLVTSLSGSAWEGAKK